MAHRIPALPTPPAAYPRMSDPEPKLPLWQGIVVFVAAGVGLPLLMLLLLWIATRFL